VWVLERNREMTRKKFDMPMDIGFNRAAWQKDQFGG